VNWQFTLALIIDKQMAFWPAMKAGWTMVHKHWWYVFGLSIVDGAGHGGRGPGLLHRRDSHHPHRHNGHDDRV